MARQRGAGEGPQRLPVVLTRAEVRVVVGQLQGTARLMALLMDVSTTQIYTHVLNRGPGGVRSPADGLLNL